jgi:hypothetical protein
MSQSKNISKVAGSLTQHVASGIKFGNTTSAMIVSTPVATSLAATDTTVTASQVLTGILSQSPSSALTVTLPAASAFLSALPPGSAVGDSFRFSFINVNGVNATTIAVDATGTLVGDPVVALTTSATFVFRLSSVSGAGTYTVHRV